MRKAFVFTAHGDPEAELFTGRLRPARGPGQLLFAVA